MSWFNRIRNVTNRLASSIIPQSVQRGLTDLGNLIINRVRPDQRFQALDEIVEHVRANYPPRPSFEVRESDSALREFARVYTIEGIEGYDARSFLDSARENITRILRNNRRTKVKLILKCYIKKLTIIEQFAIVPANFHSRKHVNLDGTDEDNIYTIMTERILEKMANFLFMGSGWTLYNIIQLELHTVGYDPLRGETWIPLPKELANKKAIINPKNEDNKCFCGAFLEH